MNSPVPLLSTRELTDFLSKVSVVSSSTFSLRELDSPIAEMVYLSGSAFSHFGFRTFRVIGVIGGARRGFMVFSGFCMSGNFVLESCIFDNILKRLHIDNEGMLITHCFVQNPLQIR